MINPGKVTSDLFTDDPEDDKGMTLLKRLRRSFLRGLFIVIPTAITLWLLWVIFQMIDGIASPIYRHLGLNIPGLGFITAIVLILLLGMFSRYLAVKFFIRTLERIFLNLPLARSVYSGARELLHAFSPEKKSRTFREVCMVEYPRKDAYAIGFITNELKFKESDGSVKRLSNVYIPLPPNPTTGILALIPSDEIISLSMSVEQGLKLVLSAGIVTPPEFSRSERAEDPDLTSPEDKKSPVETGVETDADKQPPNHHSGY